MPGTQPQARGQPAGQRHHTRVIALAQQQCDRIAAVRGGATGVDLRVTELTGAGSETIASAMLLRRGLVGHGELRVLGLPPAGGASGSESSTSAGGSRWPSGRWRPPTSECPQPLAEGMPLETLRLALDLPAPELVPELLAETMLHPSAMGELGFDRGEQRFRSPSFGRVVLCVWMLTVRNWLSVRHCCFERRLRMITEGRSLLTMPRIPVRTVEDAPAASQEGLRNLKAKIGKVLNIHGEMAHSPVVLGAYTGIQQAIAEHGSFDASTQEAIALAIGAADNCDYCQAAHTGGARQAGWSLDQTVALRSGESIEGQDKLHALLAVARQIATNVGEVDEDTWQRALDAGWRLERRIGKLLLDRLSRLVPGGLGTERACRTASQSPVSKASPSVRSIVAMGSDAS
jgi:AhpD family alkylhydroperoxidase